MRTILLAALSLLALTHAHAASFNCKAAHTPREQAICSDPRLSSLDDELSISYKNARTKLSSDSFALVQSDQREWLRWLDRVCSPESPAQGRLTYCLTSHYGSRLNQLNDIQRIGEIVFYPRAHFVFTAATKAQREQPHSDNDPGFGYQELAWPQIDQPTPEQDAWNTAVFAAAQKVQGITPDNSDPDLETCCTRDGFYNLIAVNDRLIDVDLGIMTYGWGAAHPNTGISSFLWWLDDRRAVAADDVFLPNSGWQQKLIRPAIKKLNTGLGEDSTWQSDNLHKAVAGRITDAQSWALSATDLKITYGQYEVAAYAFGMPSVTFTWSELHPYLNPTLHPETLPRPLKQTK